MFDLIEADPPWNWKSYSSKGMGKSPEKHYATMTDDDITSLPVNHIASPNSLLFLWATFPKLPLAMEVMKAWGFEYVTCAFLQVKRNRTNSWFMGTGYYTRANSEPCLLGKKGKGLGLPANRSISQIIGDDPHSLLMENLFDDNVVVDTYARHSKKPVDVYDKIDLMYPNVNKIRLFARDKRPNWVSLGNEINGKDIREELEILYGLES